MKTVVHATTVPGTLGFLEGHIKYQLQRGWRVVVVSSPQGDKLERVAQRLGCQYEAISMSRGASPLRDLRALLQFIRLFRRLRPDIVHAYTPKAGLLAPIAARAVRAPGVIVSLFGLRQMTLQGLGKCLLDSTTRLSTSMADVVWCDSASVRDVVVSRRLAAPSKVLVLGPGSVAGVDFVDTFDSTLYERNALRASLNIGVEDQVIGFVGRLNIDKGMRELASAWLELRQSHPKAHLVLIGPKDGHLPDEVLSQFEFGERSHWLGAQELVAPWLATMDVFAMPSYREGFCVANIEASAMSLPIVSTLVPGCVDSVIQGVTGTLVPPRDAEGLAGALRRYLDDPALRRRHGEQGRSRVESLFAPRDFWVELEELYRQMLRLDRGRGAQL